MAGKQIRPTQKEVVMAEVHTKSRKIIDEQGKVLFLERATVLVDGDEVRVDSERRVSRCPTCGSRLDKVQSLGRCWECDKEVCTNCGIKAACCGRTLCEEHRHLSLLNNERIAVCREHAPVVADRQELYDSVLLFNQKLKEQEQRHAAELRQREMKLKEASLAFQRALGSRRQVVQEAVTRERLALEHARVRMDQLRTLAPNASRLLGAYRSGALSQRRR